MSNEKLPEHSGWKQGLDHPSDDPQGTTGWAPSDREAAWNKLHARLGGKPRPRFAWATTRIISGGPIPGAAWYWAAASIIIIAISVWLLVPGKGRLRETARNGKPKAASGPAILAGTGTEAVEAKKAGAASKEDRRSYDDMVRIGTRPAAATPARAKPHIPVRTEEPDVAAGNSIKAYRPDADNINTNRLAVITTSTRLTAPAGAQPTGQRQLRPLRVVHENELDPSPGPHPSIAGGSPAVHWLRLGNRHDQNLYSAEDDAVRPVPPIITIHLSPQN